MTSNAKSEKLDKQSNQKPSSTFISDYYDNVKSISKNACKKVNKDEKSK